MPGSISAGDVLGGRYQLTDLLAESEGGRFWRAKDLVLHRPVAVHIIGQDDPRKALLFDAARRSAKITDRRILRVLDANESGPIAFVVNEWGQGLSLDRLLSQSGPLSPRRAAWLTHQVAETLALAHEVGVAHGRLVPENVLVDNNGQVRLIGFAVDAALHNLDDPSTDGDITQLAGILYAALTGHWPGPGLSQVPVALREHGRVLRARRVRAGIPGVLDQLSDQLLNPRSGWSVARPVAEARSATDVALVLQDFLGDESTLEAGPRPFGPVAQIDLSPEPHQAVGGHGGWAAATAYAAEQAAAVQANPGSANPGSAGSGQAEPDTEQSRAEQSRAEPEPTEPEAAEPAPAEPQPAEPDADATVAGMPIFEDSGDVGWIAAVAPKYSPPTLEEPEPKPLFAPEPKPGEPVRRPRYPGAGQSDSDFWPWEDPDAPARKQAEADTDSWRTRSGTGSWGVDRAQGEWAADEWAADEWSAESGSWRTGSWHTGGWQSGDLEHSGDLLTDTGEHVDKPGSLWLRVAVVIGALAAIFLIGAALQNLFFDEPNSEPSSTPSANAQGQPVVLKPTAVSDYDPQGDTREEYPELVPLATDRNPGTSWRTQGYNENFGPAGLKTGVGLVFDLGAEHTVNAARVTVAGGSHTLKLFVTTEPPSNDTPIDRSEQPVATGSGDALVVLQAKPPARGRYVTVWLTGLPRSSDGRFRGSIAEVVIRGR